MSTDSVCQVARSWVDVGSIQTRLIEVMYVTRGDFYHGSEKGTASMYHILCQFWETCYADPHNDTTSLRGPNLESCIGVSMTCPVQDWSHIG